MPAEHVFGMQHSLEGGPVELGPNGPQVPLVDVRWARDDGFVQVVSRADNASGGRWAGEDSEMHVTDGLYVDLDRNAVNRLIRNLRRARDQAFGADA